MTCSGTADTCTSCVPPNKLLDASPNTCGTCTASNCDKCSSDGLKCVTCLRPYSYLPKAADGVCYSCASNTCYHCL